MEINVTLVSILVIVLLFIPGFFFKRFYYTGKFTKQFHSGTFAERFITSIFWGLFVQCITASLAGNFMGAEYNDIRQPVTDYYGALSKDTLPYCTSSHLNYGIGYIIATIIIGAVLGYLSHLIVRTFRLDVHIPVLQFANHWNYYFRGDLKRMRGSSQNGKVISANLDLLVDDGSGKNRIYTGFLVDYTISNSTGELETIVLTQAERWSQSTNAFKPIQSDSFILPYNTVKNLNLRYNIASRTKKQKVDAFTNIVALISFVAAVFVIPVIYYSKIGLLFTIIAAVVGAIDSLLLTTLVYFTLLPPGPMENQSAQQSRTANIAAIVVLALIVALLTYALYRIIY